MLCELVRKREKLKAIYIRTVEQSIMMQLNPLEEAMTRLLDSIFTKDSQEIFTEPVDVEEVPDYMDVVTHPMDLSTMRTKLREGKYATLDDMENDFNLMIQNCLAYNNKDTIFYRAGVRMRDQCGPLFKAVRKELIRDGIVEKPQSDESIAHEVDAELAALLEQNLPHEELILKLHELMEKTLRIKHGMVRQKRVKAVKVELMKAKKSSSRTGERSDSYVSPTKLTPSTKSVKRALSPMDTSQSDDPDESNKLERASQLITPTCSPVKNVNNSASPSGVNRRTAVLFTRKAKAAASLKKLEASAENEVISNVEQSKQQSQVVTLQTSTPTHAATTNDNPKSKSPKKLSRSGRNSSFNSEAGNAANFDSKNGASNASSLAVPSTSSSSAGMNSFQKKISPIAKERYVPSNIMPDSFRTYRGRGIAQSSESDDSMNMSCMHSECSSCSGSEFG